MPDWMKGVLVLAVIGAAAVYSWNVILIGSMEEDFEKFEQTTEEVNSAGTVFGTSSTAEGCLAELVRRVGGCEGDPMCGTLISPFLWSCLEAAPRDEAFCADVPEPGDDRAMKAWGQKTCTRHGRPADELCSLVVGLTIGYCSTQTTAS
jgi:hypothetical protein